MGWHLPNTDAAEVERKMAQAQELDVSHLPSVATIQRSMVEILGG